MRFEVKIPTKVRMYLEQLRESGQINMLYATKNLQEDFNYSQIEARQILSQWLME